MIHRRIWYINIAYLLVGLTSMAIGFYVASRFLKKSYSATYTLAQQEVENTQPAANIEDVPPVPPGMEDSAADDSTSSEADQNANAGATTADEIVVQPTAQPQETSAEQTQPQSEEAVPAPQATPPASSGQGGAGSAVNSRTMLPESVSLLEPYVFDTREGRRNPFKPPIVNLGAGMQADVSVGPGTPLERYEVDEVKLAAILWDIKNPKAMFIDPTGEVHILTKDDRIGRRRGYVAAIRESEVVVVEITSFSGEQQYSTRILRIDQ